MFSSFVKEATLAEAPLACGRGSCSRCTTEASTSYSSYPHPTRAPTASLHRQHRTCKVVHRLRHLRHQTVNDHCACARDVASAASGPQQQQQQVVLTRERGKNGKLMQALQKRGISVLEMPLVETIPGPDGDHLPAALQQGNFDWVVITSPEAASVFLRGWEAADRPQMRLAVVGAGTGKVLEEAAQPALTVAFTPTKANADHLSAQLPLEHGGSVLYPASAKAGSTLQEGLEQRGFTVRRLNTYNTVPVESLSPADVDAARSASVAAFASPSAVKSWLALVGGQDAVDVAIACIGADAKPDEHCIVFKKQQTISIPAAAALPASTTAQAAEKLGLRKVYFPDAPGLEGFVESIMEALEQNDRSRTLSVAG